jgi:hypothetical protein
VKPRKVVKVLEIVDLDDGTKRARTEGFGWLTMVKSDGTQNLRRTDSRWMVVAEPEPEPVDPTDVTGAECVVVTAKPVIMREACDTSSTRLVRPSLVTVLARVFASSANTANTGTLGMLKSVLAVLARANTANTVFEHQY